MKTLSIALTFLVALPLAAAAEVTKEDLKKLAAAGISDDVILSYIKSNGGVAKLSAEDIIELKQAGASEKVLSVALGNAPAPAATRDYSPPAGSDTPRVTYVAPSTTTYVYDSPYYSPYYGSSTYASFYVGGYYPYYYPRYYYNNCSPYVSPYRSYGSYAGYCAPRTYSTGYCAPKYYSGGYSAGYSRGYAGVSGYRR